jgi:hypothetical protein
MVPRCVCRTGFIFTSDLMYNIDFEMTLSPFAGNGDLHKTAAREE